MLLQSRKMPIVLSPIVKACETDTLRTVMVPIKIPEKLISTGGNTVKIFAKQLYVKTRALEIKH